MPTNSFCRVKLRPPFTSLKKIKLVLAFIACPLFFFGQTLTGLWTGALSNDSNTVRKDQSFEIALTEYKGKVYGYSRSEFIVDDTLYYIVKRVKGTIEGDVCEVVDDEIVSYNFRGKLDKGIKVTSTFRRNQNDSMWYLDGTWKTNATKKYYAVSGKVNLEEEKDLSISKIFPHLEELKLADEIAFYKDRKEGAPIARLAKPEKIKTEYSTKKDLGVDVSITAAKPDLQRVDNEQTIAIEKPSNDLPKTDAKTIESNTVAIKPGSGTKTIAETVYIPEEKIDPVKKPEGDLAKTETNRIPSNNTKLNPAAADRKIVENKIPPPEKTNNAATVAVNKPAPADNKAVVKTNTPPAVENKKPVATTRKDDIATSSTVKKDPVVTAAPAPEKKEMKTEPIVVAAPREKKPTADLIAQASMLGGRKSEFNQFVDFKSDSLELSLYDNGEIDGDTVSIYLNGEVIMSKQGLKASAIKKTIYITPGKEDFTLVLFAENLGKYPPNTGLLVVHDGEDTYNIRFSADLQKSSGIIFRRKN